MLHFVVSYLMEVSGKPQTRYPAPNRRISHGTLWQPGRFREIIQRTRSTTLEHQRQPGLRHFCIPSRLVQRPPHFPRRCTKRSGWQGPNAPLLRPQGRTAARFPSRIRRAHQAESSKGCAPICWSWRRCHCTETHHTLRRAEPK